MIAHKKTARPGEKERFEKPKIIVQDISIKIIATYDNQNYYVKDAILIHSKTGYPEINLKYILAILNSRLMNFIYSISFPSIQVAKNELAQLPLKEPSPETKKYLAMMAERMLSLNKKLYNENLSNNEKKDIKITIKEIANEIDNKVYNLYGLTKEEIDVVESRNTFV